MIRRPPRSTRTDTLFPYTTLFRSQSGRPGFLIRAALATTMAGVWGLYSGFELCESAPLPGKEEYLHSEKYELRPRDRSEEHTSELQSLMRISYAVFCLKQKNSTQIIHNN